MDQGAFFSEFNIDEDNQSFECKVNRCDLSIINGVRRILYAETPMLAIDLINMEENTCVLHDEFLSHSIGLLPIDSNDLDDFKRVDECDSDFLCEKCSVYYECNVTNDTTKNRTVYSSDLVSQNPKYKLMFTDTGDLPMPFAKLAPGESLRFTAIAMKNVGNEHSKWCPVTSCTITYEPDHNASKVDQFRQKERPTNFTMNLETTVSIKPTNALTRAMDILIDKLVRFDKSVDTIKF